MTKRTKAENSIAEGPGNLPDNPETVPPVDETEDEGAGTDVAPPLTGEERLRLLEYKIEHLYDTIHGLASHTFTSAEAKAAWLKDHFEVDGPSSETATDDQG